MESAIGPFTDSARWWVGRPELLERLEQPSMGADPTIRRLSDRTLRRHPDLARVLATYVVSTDDVLAYQATADGPYGLVRLAALFLGSPFDGIDPSVYALDGERKSLHRNPPRDTGTEDCSAHLCLYFTADPDERRWTPEYGLIGLFDLGRRHLLAEHIWRSTGEWPFEDAEHGDAARPVPPRPELRVEPLRFGSA
jgi:hypothetical protein